MANGFMTRRATVSDADAIARVRMVSWQAAYRGLMPDAVLDGMELDASAQRIRHRLNANAEAERANPAWSTPKDHVCVQENEVIGWSSFGPSRDHDHNRAQTAELYAIYCLPEVFGQGIGHALLGAVLEDVRAVEGYRVLTLWVLASNVRAIEFYTRHGFDADGRTKTEIIGERFEILEARYSKIIAPR